MRHLSLLLCLLTACARVGSRPSDAAHDPRPYDHQMPYVDRAARDARADAPRPDVRASDGSSLDARKDSKMLDSKPDGKKLDGKPDSKKLDGKPDSKKLDGKPDSKKLDGKIPDSKLATKDLPKIPDTSKIDVSKTSVVKVVAESSLAQSGYMYRWLPTCPSLPPPAALGPTGDTVESWTVEAYYSGPDSHLRNAYLGFNTQGVLPLNATISSATLRVYHHSVIGQNDPVQAFGGTQPLWASLAPASFDGGTLIGTETMASITSKGYAEFSIPIAQINRSGHTQFKLALQRTCPYPPPNNYWRMVAPSTTDKPKRPVLLINIITP
jgi:hypothetical protein